LDEHEWEGREIKETEKTGGRGEIFIQKEPITLKYNT
jgi:hypothetical protein